MKRMSEKSCVINDRLVTDDKPSGKSLEYMCLVHYKTIIVTYDTIKIWQTYK